ncbi:MAG: hypothetical protein NZM40_07110 [Sphingomonadaceae bacterium]|nr:hypothetical protein [Sphingomonadaceae bacterium]MDW8415783.1 hypothetical protein [Thermaurantiacus sp.]
MTGLTPAEVERIERAIARAEERTAGEILCVVDTQPHVYREWALALAALGAFVVPFLLALAGLGPAALLGALGGTRWLAEATWSEQRLIEAYAALQLIVFALLALVLPRTPLARRLAPAPLRRDRVHELALRQFLARGIHLTDRRTGVLILVAVPDRIAEIVADAGIYARVTPEVWAEADAVLLAALARGDLAGGLEAAIAKVGEVLAAHFPREAGDRDELPNRLIQL